MLRLSEVPVREKGADSVRPEVAIVERRNFHLALFRQAVLSDEITQHEPFAPNDLLHP